MASGVEFSDLHWIAIAVSVVFNMILGFVWYAPKTPTGKIWMKHMGMDPNKTKPTGGQMAMGIILATVGAFLLFFVFGHNWEANRDAYDLDEAGDGYEIPLVDGLMGGFFTWLGFFVPILLSSVAWEGKPWALFLVNASYYLVTLLAASVFFVYL